MTVKSISEIDAGRIKSFSCGNNELDVFLRKYALHNDQSGYGKTFVLEDNDEVIGYFTLCSSSIKFEEYPITSSDKLPRDPIPCIRIARLAVARSEQGKGFGKELLKQAFLRILSVSTTIGIRLIVVDAKESSASFYVKYGFSKLKSDKLSYYLLITTLQEAIK